MTLVSSILLDTLFDLDIDDRANIINNVYSLMNDRGFIPLDIRCRRRLRRGTSSQEASQQGALQGGSQDEFCNKRDDGDDVVKDENVSCDDTKADGCDDDNDDDGNAGMFYCGPTFDKKQWKSFYIGMLADLESDTITPHDAMDNLSLIFTKGKRNVLVYFYLIGIKLAQAEMQYLDALAGQKSANQIIIVSKCKATPKVTSSLELLNAQLFSEDELRFNLTKHQLQPEFTALSTDEKNSILDYYTKDSQGVQHPEYIPGMFTTDPIRKWYNWKVGTLIRITRHHEDGTPEISYRIVCKPTHDKDKNK